MTLTKKHPTVAGRGDDVAVLFGEVVNVVSHPAGVVLYFKAADAICSFVAFVVFWRLYATLIYHLKDLQKIK